jgi:hypothetical protein
MGRLRWSSFTSHHRLQSRGNVGICALMRCGCRINSAGRAGGFGFVSALESRYRWKRLTDLCLSSRPTPAAGPVRNPEQPEFSPPRYGQSAPLFAAVHESAIGPSPHFAAEQQPRRFRSKADINLCAARRRFYQYTALGPPDSGPLDPE